MTATRALVLDRAATYGLFSTSESQDMAAVVLRLRNVNLLKKIEDVLSYPNSNVKIDHYYQWILDQSGQHNLKLPVLSCLKNANNTGE